MQDIRLVDNDGEYLNLETQGGEKFRLVLDDSLRAAMKREPQINLDSVSISPREIQDEVRAGSTAEEVAAKHSVPLDYVEKFALTVVDEIGHIIASAQTVRILVEADRYSEATQLEFGEVLEGRLRKSEASNISWSATKREGSPWMVSVSYDSPNGASEAVWSFDQRKLVLTPESEAAIKLSAGEFAAGAASPKLRKVDVSETAIIEIPRAGIDTHVEQLDTPEILAPISSIEELTRSTLQSVDADFAPVPASSLSPTADLLDALRKKRQAATANTSESSEASPITEPAESAVEAVEEVKEIDPAPITAKKGRPSMPSWDEIVFGTKTDD